MIDMNLRSRPSYFFILLAVSALTLPTSNAQTDDPAIANRDPVNVPPEFIEVVLPSDTNAAGRSVVRWSDVAKSIAEPLKLDDVAAASLLPRGEIHLDDPMVGLFLLGLKVAADGAVAVDRIRTPSGSLGLRVRCRRDLLPGGQKRTFARHAAFDIDDDWPDRTFQRPLVVFLHGMQSDGDAFSELREFVRRSGFATSAVTYDYDASIRKSALTLSALVAKRLTAGGDPTTKLILIGHSMGGLVAREWTENPSLSDSAITSLITIGTPHAGSNWASLPPMMDLFAGNGLNRQTLIDVLLHQPSSPGVRDLIPGSAFLTYLNSRPRRKGVRYTSIVGSGSPVTASDAAQLRETLKTLDQDGSFLRLIRPRIRPLLESFDELAAGKGDGVVSIESGKRQDCDDNVIVDVSHFDMVRQFNADQDPSGRSPVWTIVRDRVEASVE